MKIGFLVAGEQVVFERLKGLTDMARQETPLATKLFQERQPDPSVLEGMKGLEKLSDELAFKLAEDIMNGAINPAVLRDLLHLNDQMAKVFDDYYFLAREVNRTIVSKVELPMLDKMAETFVGQATIADKELEALGRLLQAHTMDEAVSCRMEIEKLEEDGDDLKDSGFDALYVNHNLLDYFTFQHYTAVLKKMDDIQDGVKDMSDLILEIVNTISR